MGISTRELFLILRARDEASRVLRGMAGNINGMGSASQQAAQRHLAQGQALVGIGTGMAIAGGAALKFFNDSATAAANYNQEAAKTLTQVDQTGVKLETIKKIGIDVAKAIPAPFEEMQGALYDIFSSMDVNVNDAKVLLTAFSKAAVAGQTDLQTAARGTITILNAWKLPASEVNRVNDVMFQLVRKGVGTYDEFAKAIGRSIPSAVRAGQSVEDLAGMMAFMTRNGLSTAMAATSAGRAFDAMAHPSTIKKMEAFGISIKDANGQFRPMVDIIGQLSAKMSKMTAPEKAKALQELFKGSGGTIQARRFFDLAINNFDELSQRTKEMHNSAGVANDAYKIMFDQPITKMQAFKNQWDIMKVSVGEAILPIRNAIVELLTQMLDAWNKLSPKTQEMIVKFLAIAAAVAVVVGIVTVVVGGILMLAGAAALAGVSLATVGIIIAAVVAAIALWVAAIIGIIKYHKQIEETAKRVWNSIKEPVMEIVHYFQDLSRQILSILLPAFQQFWVQIKNGAMAAWESIQHGIQILKGAAEDLKTIFYALKLDVVFEELARVIKTVFEVALLSAVYVIRMFIDIAGGILGPLIQLIGQWFEGLAKIIAGVIKLIAGLLTGDWAKAWAGAKQIFDGFKQFVTAGLKAFVTIVFNILAAMATRLYDTFKMMWQRGLNAIVSTTGQIISYVAGIPPRVINALISLAGRLFNWAKGAFGQAKTGIAQKASEIIAYVRGIPGRIVGAIGNTGRLLYNAGRNILQGLLNGISSMIGSIRSKLGAVTNMIPSWKGPKERDLKLLEPNAGWIMQGLITGFQKNLPALREVLSGVTDEVQMGVTPQGGGAPRMGVQDRAPDWAKGVLQNFYITTQEIDPRQHAAELGYEVAKKVSK